MASVPPPTRMLSDLENCQEKLTPWESVFLWGTDGNGKGGIAGLRVLQPGQLAKLREIWRERLEGVERSRESSRIRIRVGKTFIGTEMILDEAAIVQGWINKHLAELKKALGGKHAAESTE
jgi:hypothetical protein